MVLKIKKWIAPVVILLLFLIAILLLWLFPSVVVDGHSMNPNLQNGEVLVGSRLQGIERGSIVVLRYDKLLIKRVIGLPGETVELIGSDIFIDGILYKEDYAVNEPENGYGELNVTLSDNEFFVLGDNRDHSSDSRVIGAVPKGNILYVVTGRNELVEGVKKLFGYCVTSVP